MGVQMTFEELAMAASEAAKGAYAVYSRYPVGAALIDEDGTLTTGCNIENASYGLTMCAERVAIFNAVSRGHRKIKAIAIAGGTESPAYPCGACRQVMAEFCDPGIAVICATLDGKIVRQTTLGELLPFNFEL